MTIGSILEDAVRYPFTDWKKILILGSVLVLGYLNTWINPSLFTVSIGFIIFLFIQGYGFKIIKKSLKGVNYLPKFNSYAEIFKDGIKVMIISFIYLIPVSILVIYGSLGYQNGMLENNPSTFFLTFSEQLIGLFLSDQLSTLTLKDSIWSVVAIFYSFILIPIYYMALANMANHNNSFKAAFKIREIFNILMSIGLKNIIIFYIFILIPFSLIIANLNINLILYLLIILTIFPFLRMYLNRFVALLYLNAIDISEEKK